MLEPQDIQKLMEVLATKDDIRNINERLDSLEERVGGLSNAIDSIVARFDVLHKEYLVLKERDSLYERWFKEIAEKVGITLTR
jgi:hypothetical protein